MVERRSLSELWLDGEAGSVTQFLSQFSNLHTVANGVSPRAFQQAFASGCLSLEENKETAPSVYCESGEKWAI